MLSGIVEVMLLPAPITCHNTTPRVPKDRFQNLSHLSAFLCSLFQISTVTLAKACKDHALDRHHCHTIADLQAHPCTTIAEAISSTKLRPRIPILNGRFRAADTRSGKIKNLLRGKGLTFYCIFEKQDFVMSCPLLLVCSYFGLDCKVQRVPANFVT